MKASGTWPSVVRRLIKPVAIFSAALIFIVFSVTAYLYRQHILIEPGDHISRKSITESMEIESPIYYRDGVTQINVLFQERHRIYVPYDELPDAWIQAITATEDQRYFDHFGLDVFGIARALIQNIKAQRIVSGASTLTQQTAKNLFNRPDRSLRSKVEEALNALRLEAKYSKAEILEFYANQFHVTGNGRGIGIAAKYYFDKTVSELTVVEAAFIAGMVKGPSLYDPFFGVNEIRRMANIKRAHERVAHVLFRMKQQGFLSEQEYEKLKSQKIPFRHGTFRYGKSSIVDEVVERLEHAPFPDLFAEYNIDNPATAGLKIITTIDEDIQRQAHYGLVHHLSKVGGILEGTAKEKFVFSSKRTRTDGIGRKYELGDLFYATISEKKGMELVVKDGNGICIVDKAALQRAANIMSKGRGGKYKGLTASSLVGILNIGDVLWVSFRGNGRCDIEFDVDLQGGVLALHKGEILAMVGGTHNSDFNRATDAKRQFGSTWKPLIYAAAFQLGWSPMDLLDNRANPFPFERVWYYPRSGHKGSADFLSLSWAGVKSENRASVWLFYHLTSRLSVHDYKKVIQKVGFQQKMDENRKQYIKRIRDDFGVISTPDMLSEIAFNAAKKSVLFNLGEGEEAVAFRSLLYGSGASKEFNKLKSVELKNAVAYNYLNIQPRIQKCIDEFEALTKRGKKSNLGLLFEDIQLENKLPEHSFWLLETLDGNRIGCGKAPLLSRPLPNSIARNLNKESDVWFDDQFRISTLMSLESQQEIKLVLMADLDPYSLDFLMYHPDFQQLINMGYINLLAQSIGLDVNLPPTLTIPLGAVDITLLDVAMMYNGILTGKRYAVNQNKQKGNILVQKVIGPEGELLYEAEPTMKQVSNFVSGLLVSDILQNIVEHGTGRRAKYYQTINKTNVPLLGKTGTTNHYKNAAFVGLVPKAYGGAWNIEDGVVLATYIGFDEPKPMIYGKTKFSGASGALPVWLQTVYGVELSGYMGRPLPEMTWEAPIQDGFFAVDVDTSIGTKWEYEEQTSGRTWIYDPENLWGQPPSHSRAFSPVNLKEAPRWNALFSTDENTEIDNARISPKDDFPEQEPEIRPRIKKPD